MYDINLQVPSRERSITSAEALDLFYADVPTLGLLGARYDVHTDTPYSVDDDVQLVCKYLQALKTEVVVDSKKIKVVDRLYKEGTSIIAD